MGFNHIWLVLTSVTVLFILYSLRSGTKRVAERCLRGRPSTSLEDSAVVPSSLPCFFINLDRSGKRRRQIEDDFKELCRPLVRVRGLDGNNEGELEDYLQPILQDRNVTLQEYLKLGNVARGSLSNTISQLTAMQEALKENYDAIVILEDDAALTLQPFWTISSFREAVDEMNRQNVSWSVLRLQYAFRTESQRWRYLDEWMKSPGTSRFASYRPGWGAMAYIVNRPTMEELVNRFQREIDGRIDCLRRRLTSSSCTTDFLILFEPMEDVYIIRPPMITYRLLEGATGTRLHSDVVNDQAELHQRFILDDVQWAMLAYEYENLKFASKAEQDDPADILRAQPKLSWIPSHPQL